MAKKEEEKKKLREELERKLREKEESRKRFTDETKTKVKEVLRAKPLYKQYEEKYHQEVELPTLEQKKK